MQRETFASEFLKVRVIKHWTSLSFIIITSHLVREKFCSKDLEYRPTITLSLSPWDPQGWSALREMLGVLSTCLEEIEFPVQLAQSFTDGPGCKRAPFLCREIKEESYSENWESMALVSILWPNSWSCEKKHDSVKTKTLEDVVSQLGPTPYKLCDHEHHSQTECPEWTGLIKCKQGYVCERTL